MLIVFVISYIIETDYSNLNEYIMIYKYMYYFDMYIYLMFTILVL